MSKGEIKQRLVQRVLSRFGFDRVIIIGIKNAPENIALHYATAGATQDQADRAQEEVAVLAEWISGDINH